MSDAPEPESDAVEPPPPQAEATVWDTLLYGLSIPERAVRSTTGVVGGAVRESAALLVPTAFQDSKTYSVLVRNTLDFLVTDVAGVRGDDLTDAGAEADGKLARMAVSNLWRWREWRRSTFHR